VNRWPRRLLYLLAVLIWLAVMSLPILAFLLATRGQIVAGDQSGSHLRLFLLQEPDEQGIGVEWVRPASAGTGCSRGTVRYFMWEGEGQDTAFCQCQDPATGEYRPPASDSCS
jgi:hypothetical protein